MYFGVLTPQNAFTEINRLLGWANGAIIKRNSDTDPCKEKTGKMQTEIRVMLLQGRNAKDC